jgi:hypothetical protein
MLRLLTRTVGEADDGERGDPRLEVSLDLDLPGLEPDECVGDRASEHLRNGRHRGVPEGHASMPSWLRKSYGV